ncbi:MAG: DUF1552 domain-containing protein, partial [bacterium]|nr:DUF1552 domain-containing protein [bacterium]
MITRKHLPRRTFLKGLGTAVALPWLDAMTPAFAGTGSSSAPCRMAFAYVPNGVILEDWMTPTTGGGFELKSILEPMAPHREHMLLVSGLTHNNG